jgi:hypothetical protein
MPSISSTTIDHETSFRATPITTNRAMAILLVINAIPLLILPFVAAIANERLFTPRDLILFFVVGFISIFPAQLFLLAFWMEFGAWPNRRRCVSIFAITVACGLYLGLSLATVKAITPAPSQPDIWLKFFVLTVMAPIMSSGLLWMLSAILTIPSWFAGYEINLRASSAPAQRQPAIINRSFSLTQLITLTAQIAIPLWALNFFLTLTEDRVAALGMVMPFLLVLLCGAPLTVALLKPKLSPSAIIAASLWCTLIAAALWAIPSQFQYVPWQGVFVFALTIASNLVALRRLGFGWRPRTT